MTRGQQRANLFAHSTFNVAALLQIARDFRGIQCSCDETQTPKIGSLNWVILIVFEDGVEWVFRSPRRTYGLQKQVASDVLASEVATLKLLRKTSNIPVPQVFSYYTTDQNDIGIPYILMSRAPGVSLSTYGWDGDSKTNCNSAVCLTSDQEEKIIRQLGEVFASLSNLRFDKLGSIYTSDGDFTIGTCLYPGLLWQDRDEFDENDIPRGPFNNAHEFYKALVSAFFAHLKDLSMEHHIFHAPVPIPQEYESYREYRIATDRWNDYAAIGSKTESEKNRLDYALAGIALMDTVPLLAEKDEQFKCSDFPLYHPDISTGNVFVDDELNITCIIDWAFASTVPQSMLLICPGLPHPRDGRGAYLTTSFIEGFTEGKDFDGQMNLDFSGSAVLWDFACLVNFDALQDYHHFATLLRSLNRDDAYQSIFKLKDRPEFLEISNFLQQYETDSDKNMRDEKQYFSCVGPERHALAQHLTMISELDPNFVADKRLWRWIGVYLGERETYMFPVSTRRKHKLSDAA